MLSSEERDGTAPNRPGRGASFPAAVGGRGEPAPGHPPGQAEHVEQRGIVLGNPDPEYFTLPRPGRYLVSVELVEHRGDSLEPLGPLLRTDPLPLEQETLEIGAGNRGDLRPEPVQGVAMNPGQEPAVAPFQLASAWCKSTSQDHSLAFKRHERGIHLRG